MSSGLSYGGRKVGYEKTPGVYRRVPDVSSGIQTLGRATQQLGAVWGQLAEDYNRELGDARVTHRAGILADQMREMRMEMLGRKGNDADGIVEEADEAVERMLAEQISAPGLSERDKRNLTNLIQHHKRGTLDRLANHTAVEMAASSVANANRIGRAALENLEANALLPHAEMEALNILNGLALKNTEDPENPNELVLEALQRNKEMVRESRIRGLLNINTPQALNMAEELLNREREKDPETGHGKGVLPAAKEQALRNMLAGRRAQEANENWRLDAQFIAGEVLASDVPYEEQLALLDDRVSDRKTRDRAKAIVRQQHQKNRRALEFGQLRDQEEWASSWYGAEFPDIAGIPGWLPEKYQKSAYAYAMKKARGETFVDDQAAVEEVELMLRDNVEKFKRTPLLLQYGSNLSDDTMRRMLGYQASMRAGKDSPEIARFLRVGREIDSVMEDLGIKRGPGDKDKREQFDAFVRGEIRARGFTLDNIPDVELRGIMRTAVQEGEVARSRSIWPWTWGDPNRSYYETVRGTREREQFYLSDIPTDISRAIVKELRAADVDEPTDQQITEQYLEGLRSGRWVE